MNEIDNKNPFKDIVTTCLRTACGLSAECASYWKFHLVEGNPSIAGCLEFKGKADVIVSDKIEGSLGVHATSASKKHAYARTLEKNKVPAEATS